jgi:cellulose biosynthesis protein BcsQ
MQHDAYISYAQADFQAAFALHEALRRAGFSSVLGAERDGQRPGDAQAQILPSGLKQTNSACLLVLYSITSAEDPVVQSEVAAALKEGQPILPVRLDQSIPRGPLAELLAGSDHGAPLWLETSANDSPQTQQIIRAVRRIKGRLCPVIAVMNLKGGVGKTTVTAQVFGSAQRLTGSRILFVDLDPQANLSQYFFRTSAADALTAQDRSIISLFEPGLQHQALSAEPTKSPADDWGQISRSIYLPPDPALIAQALLPFDSRGRLDIIIGQFEVSKYAFLGAADGIERAQANFVAALERFRRSYDLIVIDTNPSASFLTRSAMAGANTILAPMRCDPFSVRGIRLLNQLMQRWQGDGPAPDLKVLANATQRTEPDAIERGIRSGQFDAEAGFPLSKAMLKAALPASKYLEIKPELAAETPLERLAAYGAKGLWARDIRSRLDTVALEVLDFAQAPIS